MNKIKLERKRDQPEQVVQCTTLENGLAAMGQFLDKDEKFYSTLYDTFPSFFPQEMIYIYQRDMALFCIQMHSKSLVLSKCFRK